MKNQDPHSQIENDELPEPNYPYENEDTEINKISTILNFMPKALPDNEIVEGINSKKQRVFSEVHKWAKDYVKYNGHKIEPIHKFRSDSGSTCKSRMAKVIYNVMKKLNFFDLHLQEYQQ